jgi:hypothetical protein
MQTVEETRAGGRNLSGNGPDTDHAIRQEAAKEPPPRQDWRDGERGQTPCPACTLLLDIQTNRCPHCNSDVSAHMALHRERARQLDQMRPLWKKITAFLGEPRARRHLGIAGTSLLLILALVTFLRFVADPLTFWIAAPVGGLVAYALLKRSPYQQPIKVDLYRTTLIFGLVAILGSMLLR